MYVSRTRPYQRALGLFAAAAIFVSLCGMVLITQRPHLSPIKTDLAPSKIVGIGLNCHGEKLPLPEVRAIGVTWVRLDLPGNLCTPDRIQDLVNYYRDFGQLWILPHTSTDRIATAKVLMGAGITEIEVFNEPELAKISPADYADTFKAIRAVIGTRARLYGPTISTWTWQRDYLDACLRAGVHPDVLSFHGYHQQTPQRLASWVSEAKSYGIPVVISELGFPTYLGAMAYRTKMSDSLGTLFVKTRDAMKGVAAWCWYDGPNPAGDNDSGLFTWTERSGYYPNHNYRDVVAAIAAGKE